MGKGTNSHQIQTWNIYFLDQYIDHSSLHLRTMMNVMVSNKQEEIDIEKFWQIEAIITEKVHEES